MSSPVSVGSGGARAARRGLAGLAVVVALGLVGLVVAVTFANRIDGRSMSPTLGDGDRVLMEPFFDIADLRRFDIVAARPTPSSPAVVKRVIGLPGDSVRIEVRPDGVPSVLVRPAGTAAWQSVDAPQWTGQWRGGQPCCTAEGKAGQGETAVVPPGRLFVLGDNPEQSDDSRKYGWVPLDGVVGRMWWRLYPLDHLGPLNAATTMRLVPTAGP